MLIDDDDDERRLQTGPAEKGCGRCLWATGGNGQTCSQFPPLMSDGEDENYHGDLMTQLMLSCHVINLISTFGATENLCSVLLVASRQAFKSEDDIHC